MAYEVKPWKKLNCSITLEVDKITNRETYSREINETYGGGGGLNANYQTAEAIAQVSNRLGLIAHMSYGVDFIFKTGDSDSIVLDFRDDATQRIAKIALHDEGMM